MQVKCDVVVPCDDGSVAQLHALHASEPSLRALIERSLGPPSGFETVRSRYRLLRLAAELGIAVPETSRVENRGDISRWHENTAQGVLKVDGESGGNGVRVCASLEESLAAWQELNQPQGWLTGVKRLAIDRDPLALWTCDRVRPEITLQRFIHGKPANAMAVCRDGRLLSLVSVVVLATDGPTGAATVIRRVDNEAMTRAARVLSERLQMSGFFGLDFMIENESEIPYLIEMNPRCTQLGHLDFEGQPSLAAAFSGTLPAIPIALFPQALRTPTNTIGESCYLDMPSELPALVAELRLDPWPQRRWAARIYHRFRGIKRSPTTEYGSAGASLAAP
jgi:ATP-grasp domain